jgi:hypothetical protein
MCVFAWFVQVRNTEAWKNNPFFPAWYILHPHKGVSSYMMGDVVLRGKLPHLKLMKFSRLVELQRA